MTENGPLRVEADFSISQNNFSWHKLADAIWVDQPVGTGYSTCDENGFVANEDQMGQDFVGFLSNLVKVFPSLATRPLYLTGESYAGTYIPYITKTIFSTPNPPVNLRKIAIGDGAIGPIAVYEEMSVVSVIETYPQIIDFDQDVYNYFREQTHLCGYDVNLTYPQNGLIPTLKNPFDEDAFDGGFDGPQVGRQFRSSLLAPVLQKLRSSPPALSRRLPHKVFQRKQAWKRDLTGRPNGTLDPFYGCHIYSELLDYAMNFTFPWTQGEFDPYDIPDALSPEAPSDASVFLNDNRTRSALHAPTSKNWRESTRYPFGSNRTHGDSPTAFMTDLATNASSRGVHIIIYSGNDDSLVAHRGTESMVNL
ncbi:hypothetical protein ONZ45_g15798 [Pleurotus djamor]|nr:hypothetical protein ONZ45_g15798 [Pleurotus djamor]